MSDWEVVGIGASDDEWEVLGVGTPTNEPQAPSSALSILSGIGRAANAASFDIPNKAVSAASAFGRKIAGDETPFLDLYESGRQDFYNTSDRYLGGYGKAADVVGAFISPVNKLKFVKSAFALPGISTILSTPLGSIGGLAARTGIGAGISVAQDIAEKENFKDTADVARESALSNLILEPTFGLTGKLLNSVGKGILNKGIGITTRDYARAAQDLDLGTTGRGKERLLQALDQVEEAGGLKYRDLARTTEGFLNKTIDKIDEVANPYTKKATEIIKKAQEAAGENKQFLPDLQLIEDNLNKLSAQDKIKVKAEILKRFDALDASVKGITTLPVLQKEKVALNSRMVKYPEESEAIEIYRRSLRSSLEKETDALAEAANNAYQKGDLKTANQKFAALQTLREGLEKDLPTAQAADLAEVVTRGGYTTGGMSPTTILNTSGLERLASIGVGAMNYLKPVGRVGGKAIRDFGTSLSEAPIRSAFNTYLRDNSRDPYVLSERELVQLNQPFSAFPELNDRVPSKEAPFEILGEERMNINPRQPQEAAMKEYGFYTPTKNEQQSKIDLLEVDPSPLPYSKSDSYSKEKDMKLQPDTDTTPRYKVDEALKKAVIWQESGGNPKAVSKENDYMKKAKTGTAKGKMQLLDATGKELFAKYRNQLPEGASPERYDPFNAEQNVFLGTRYLEELLEQFDGDLELALTAYHSGPGKVRNLLRKTKGSTLNDILPFLGKDGKKYAKRIIGKYQEVLSV